MPEKVKEQRGAAFKLADFHEQALAAGAVPMPAVERIVFGGEIGGVALNDGFRADRTGFSVVNSFERAAEDGKEFWRSTTIAERLRALEFIRQTLFGYDPDTAPFQRVPEITRHP
jgi:hypothetical protein